MIRLIRAFGILFVTIYPLESSAGSWGNSFFKGYNNATQSQGQPTIVINNLNSNVMTQSPSQASSPISEDEALTGGDPEQERNRALLALNAKDYDRAFKWYFLAAQHNDAVSQKHLGTMYLKGQGVTQSDKQAKYWFTRSADQGNEAAQKALNELSEASN